MRPIESLTIGLTAAAFTSEVSAHPTQKREPSNNGWPGQDVTTVVNSPIFKTYNYTTYEGTLPSELKGKVPTDSRAYIFPQDDGTIHFAPKLDCLQPLVTNPEKKIDDNCSLSSIVLTLDGNSTTVAGAQFWVHPKGEEEFVEGDPKEHLNPKVKQFLKESTNSDFNSEEFVDAALNCGVNAIGYGTGENFEKDAGKYKVKVLKGNGAELSIAGISNKDCYIYVSQPNEPNDNTTENCWIGEEVSKTINNSPYVYKYNHTVCPDTAYNFSPQILNKNQQVCDYPEGKGQVTSIPDPAYFDYLGNLTSPYYLHFDPDKSLSAITIDHDDNQRIVKATLSWPTLALGFMYAHGGNREEYINSVLLPLLKEVTGKKDIDPKDAEKLANAAERCGVHAEGDKYGNNYSINFGELTAIVREGENNDGKPNYTNSFKKDIKGDCGITVFKSSESNNSPEKNSAPTLSTSLKARTLTAAGAATFFTYFRFIF